VRPIYYLRLLYYLISFIAGLLITSCSDGDENPVTVTPGVVFTNQFLTPGGTSVKFQGAYPEVKGRVHVEEFGFIYTEVDLDDSESASQDITIENGIKFIPEAYDRDAEYEITGLEYQAPYRIRPYLVSRDSIYYGKIQGFTTFPPLSADLIIYGTTNGGIIVEGLLRNYTEFPYQQLQLLITRIPQPGHNEIEITQLNGIGDVKYFSYSNPGLLSMESRYYVSVLMRVNDEAHYVGGTTIYTP
jgi:hypothetical protein